MAMTISDDDVPGEPHNYHVISFYDDNIVTLVTDTPSYVDSWISDIEHTHRRRLHNLVVGLDIEWRPNFIKNHENPVATLQLCVGRRCLIFQLLYSPKIPQSLKNFLCNPSYTFTGVGIDSDVEKLKRDYDLEIGRTADLRYMAAARYGKRELRNEGIVGLTRWVMGKELSKPKFKTMSRWDNDKLTWSQVEYACIDAFVSFEIGRILIYGSNCN